MENLKKNSEETRAIKIKELSYNHAEKIILIMSLRKDSKL